METAKMKTIKTAVITLIAGALLLCTCTNPFYSSIQPKKNKPDKNDNEQVDRPSVPDSLDGFGLNYKEINWAVNEDVLDFQNKIAQTAHTNFVVNVTPSDGVLHIEQAITIKDGIVVSLRGQKEGEGAASIQPTDTGLGGDALFTVSGNAKLILRNITLSGNNDKTTLVNSNGGETVMEAGSKITRSISVAVTVQGGGSFTMKEGSDISGNTIDATAYLQGTSTVSITGGNSYFEKIAIADTPENAGKDIIFRYGDVSSTIPANCHLLAAYSSEAAATGPLVWRNGNVDKIERIMIRMNHDGSAVQEKVGPFEGPP
jgi:hypothetical protein